MTTTYLQKKYLRASDIDNILEYTLTLYATIELTASKLIIFYGDSYSREYIIEKLESKIYDIMVVKPLYNFIIDVDYMAQHFEQYMPLKERLRSSYDKSLAEKLVKEFIDQHGINFD